MNRWKIMFKHNLLTGITIRRGASTNVVLRNYTYDALGRPLTRSTARNGTTQNDTFGYNARSKLTSATLGNDNYAYAFDNIGNRATETVAIANSESRTANYSTNNLNQYDSVVQNTIASNIKSSSSSQEEGDRATGAVEALAGRFVPEYDANRNATLIQTSTGTWQVSYNGANRPVRFRNEENDTTIDCGYGPQGRRLHFPKHREILKIPFAIRKRISCYFP